MLGLRADIDHQNIKSLRPSSAHKTYKFASSLNGRFFVQGISGGFDKHKKPTAKPTGKSIAERKLALIASRENRQEKELEKDVIHLQQLEEQLQEIRYKKELKKQRQDKRQIRKNEYKAAFTIQRSYKCYKLRQKQKAEACNIIVNYIKSMKNKQAVHVAAWAATKIKRFALKCTRKYIHDRVVEETEELSSILVEQYHVALVDEMIDDMFANELDQIVTLRSKLIQVKNNSSSKTHKSSISSNLSKKQTSSHAKDSSFFLTESMYDSMIPAPPQVTVAASINENCLNYMDINIKSLHDYVNSGDSTKPLIRPVLKPPLKERKLSNPRVLVSAKQQKPPIPVTGIDDKEDERIRLLHSQRMLDMKEERERRLKIVEQQKIHREAAAALIEQQKNVMKHEKDRKKKEFLQQIEELQQKSKVAYLKRQEERRRLSMEEESRRQREAKEKQLSIEEQVLMRKEDILVPKKKIVVASAKPNTTTTAAAAATAAASIVDSVIVSPPIDPPVPASMLPPVEDVTSHSEAVDGPVGMSDKSSSLAAIAIDCKMTTNEAIEFIDKAIISEELSKQQKEEQAAAMREVARKRMLEYLYKEKQAKQLAKHQEDAKREMKVKMAIKALTIIQRNNSSNTTSSSNTSTSSKSDKVSNEKVHKNSNANTLTAAAATTATAPTTVTTATTSAKAPVVYPNSVTDSSSSTSTGTSTGTGTGTGTGTAIKRKNMSKHKASPYFSGIKAVVSAICTSPKRKQQQHVQSKKLGKVASLLAMVTRARNKLNYSATEKDMVATGHDDASSGIEDVGVEENTNVITAIALSPPSSTTALVSPIQHYVQQSESLDSEDDINGDDGNDDDSDDDEFLDEQALDNECEMLRRQLESKISMIARDTVDSMQQQQQQQSDNATSNIADSGVSINTLRTSSSSPSMIQRYLQQDSSDETNEEAVDRQELKNSHSIAYLPYNGDDGPNRPEDDDEDEDEDREEHYKIESYDELVMRETEELRRRIFAKKIDFLDTYTLV